MHDVQGILVTAIQLILALEPELVEIVLLSLKVSISAVIIATVVSIPLGTFLGAYHFPGRDLIIGILNAYFLIETTFFSSDKYYPVGSTCAIDG